MTYLTFTRTCEGMPGLFTVAEIDSETKAKLPYVAFYPIRYQARLDGWPEGNELNRCCRLEDALAIALKPQGAVHGGHITGAGKLLAVFHAPIPLPDVAKVKAGLFKSVGLTGEARHDPGWEWHAVNMAPTSEERFQEKNRRHLQALVQAGDDHDKPREVDFFSYFLTQESREAFKAAIRTNGFAFVDGEDSYHEEDENPFGCQFHLTTSVDALTIGSLCGYLHTESSKVGGNFDGWGCPVIK